MSYEENTSFWDEIQSGYKITGISYNPMYVSNAGMEITLEISETKQRPPCPLCASFPVIHEYKKKR